MMELIERSAPLDAATLQQAARESGRATIQVITPGWGSSGYYSEAVLKDAGAQRVFPAGTQMFIDHPSFSERSDRPERSLKDLASYLLEDAHWDDQAGALVAEAQVFPNWVETLAAMQEAIGVSIRANGIAEHGEAAGREGMIITAITEGISVDFVTQAGRGGKVLALAESAPPRQVVARAVAAGVTEATANDTRDALQSALRERFPGENVWVYVRDFDATTVWYEHGTPDEDATYALPYTATDDGTVEFGDADPVEVRVHTEYVPVDPAGQSNTTQESRRDTMPQIEETHRRQLEEAERRVQTAEEARRVAEQRAQVAERGLAEANGRATARPIAAEVVNASESLPPSTRTRVIDAAVAGVQLGEDGSFDQAGFRSAVESAREAAEAEIAEALQTAGAGRIRGAGHTSGGSGEVTEADFDSAIAGFFGRPTVKES